MLETYEYLLNYLRHFMTNIMEDYQPGIPINTKYYYSIYIAWYLNFCVPLNTYHYILQRGQLYWIISEWYYK